MAVSINTNVASINAQSRLTRASDVLQASFERLSSGLRITRPSSDGAGLAVASSLRVDARIASQGIRNVNDAISFLSIAEGAMTELSSIIDRIQELATQSANGTLTAAQRRSLNSEAKSLRAEYSRITATTAFNSIDVLTGQNSILSVEAGGTSVDFDNGGIRTGGSGDGTFKASLSFNVGASPNDVISADVNRDGFMDLITADSGEINVLLGNGDATFKSRISTAAAAGASYSIDLGDLNGDGILDLVSADNTADQVSYYLGSGTGTFGPRVSMVAGTGPNGIAIGDLNNDGMLDFVSVEGVTNSLGIYLNAGGGTFKTRVSVGVGGNPQEVRIDDFNSDGNLDIAIAEDSTGTISVLLGTGTGSFRPRLSIAVGSGPIGLDIGDFNSDGFLDLVTADCNDETVSVVFGNGNGTFRSRFSYNGGAGTISVSTGDYNGDGQEDIAAVGEDVVILLSNANGSFKSPTTYASGSNPYWVTTSDLNSDGIPDIAVNNTSTNQVSLLLGNGNTNTLTSISLLSQSASLEAITEMKSARNKLLAALGRNGAQQSRLQSIASNLRIKDENYQSAASQILDVDVAQESATLARTRIIQQAATSVLAQANLQNQIALQLLT